MNTQSSSKRIVVLGTGGTIAGTASNASDNIGYTAAQLSVAELLNAVPGLTGTLQGHTLVSEQVAQIDSKDMGFGIWVTLAQRVEHHLSQSDIAAVVVTHGTDTLEETAYFLHVVLSAKLINAKPVVLTGAMRPASALIPDGQQNLMDAMAVAVTPGAQGVVTVCAGTVHGALEVQKSHTYKLDAFTSGDAGPLAYVEEGQLRLLRSWPLAKEEKAPNNIARIASSDHWPRVEIVMNYVGSNGAMVDALVRPCDGIAPLRGLVVAGTGNGTMHHDLQAALYRAMQAGVKVVRATRCASGRVLPANNSEFAHSDGLSPVKARIALMLELLG